MSKAKEISKRRLDAWRFRTIKPGSKYQVTQRTTSLVSGAHAWNLNNQGQPNAQSAANAELGRFMIAISPHGFIKSARAARDVPITDRYVQTQNRTLKVVGFTTMEKYRVTGEFNDQFLLERLITRIPNPVLGDIPRFAALMFKAMRDPEKRKRMRIPKKPEIIETLRGLLEAGRLTPVIGRTFGLHEVPAAMKCMQDGQLGRVIVVP